MTKFVAAIFLPVVLVLAAASTRRDLVRVRRDWVVFVLAALLAVVRIAPWFVTSTSTRARASWRRFSAST